MPRSTSRNAVEQLLVVLDEAFGRQSWHGANLRGSIRGLPARQAEWRPAAGRRSIAEIAVHAAYWKYTVRRRLTGEARGSFPLPGSNWFALESPLGEAAWKQYASLLADQHRRLVRAVGALTDADLAAKSPGGKYPLGKYVRGVALHDVYHAGQIQTLKALQKSAAR